MLENLYISRCPLLTDLALDYLAKGSGETKPTPLKVNFPHENETSSPLSRRFHFFEWCLPDIHVHWYNFLHAPCTTLFGSVRFNYPDTRSLIESCK